MSEFNKTTISNTLNKLIEDNNITQAQLANDLGISNMTISYYTTGKRIPSVDMLINLSNYFDVSIDYLCGISETKQPGENNMLDFNESTIDNLKNHLKGKEKDIYIKNLNYILSSKEFTDIIDICRSKTLIEEDANRLLKFNPKTSDMCLGDIACLVISTTNYSAIQDHYTQLAIDKFKNLIDSMQKLSDKDLKKLKAITSKYQDKLLDSFDN